MNESTGSTLMCYVDLDMGGKSIHVVYDEVIARWRESIQEDCRAIIGDFEYRGDDEMNYSVFSMELKIGNVTVERVQKKTSKRIKVSDSLTFVFFVYDSTIRVSFHPTPRK